MIPSSSLFSMVKRGLLRRLKLTTQAAQDRQALSYFLRSRGIDVVLAEYGPTAVSVMGACADAKVALVAHFHGRPARLRSNLRRARHPAPADQAPASADQRHDRTLQRPHRRGVENHHLRLRPSPGNHLATLSPPKTAVIPPKHNRVFRRSHDRELYKERHLIENFFCKLKQYRAIVTRYDKTARNFLAVIYLVSTVIWLN